MASESKIAPYVIGGLGAYNVKNKVESLEHGLQSTCTRAATRSSVPGASWA